MAWCIYFMLSQNKVLNGYILKICLAISLDLHPILYTILALSAVMIYSTSFSTVSY